MYNICTPEDGERGESSTGSLDLHHLFFLLHLILLHLLLLLAGDQVLKGLVAIWNRTLRWMIAVCFLMILSFKAGLRFLGGSAMTALTGTGSTHGWRNLLFLTYTISDTSSLRT